MRRRKASLRLCAAAATSAVFVLAACGLGERADGSVTVVIRSPLEMPFHGPGGPGTEPMSIDFRWTVVVAAFEGADCVVGPVRTRLTERASGAVLTDEDASVRNLGAGENVELRQQASGTFHSSLYPGEWVGVTTVEVSHRSGRRETVRTSFTFR